MKLTQRMLAERMAADHNLDAVETERFISEFFSLIAKSLSESGAVTIKGLGSFRSDVRSGNVMIDYVPDSRLSEQVNAPFSFFEPVKLSDSVTDEMLDAIDRCGEIHEKTETPAETADNEVEIATVDRTAETAETPTAETTNIEPVITLIPEEAIDEADSQSEELSAEETDASVVDEPMVKKGRGNIAAIIVALIVGMVVGFFAGYYYNRWLPERSEAEQPVAEVTESKEVPADEPGDTTEIVAEAPVSEEYNPAVQVTDTVKSSYYFTHMAKKYYGNKHFWSYIYEENKDILDHPEKVNPGVVVVIPPAEKYDIDPDNPESVKAAKALGYEIYGRFSR